MSLNIVSVSTKSFKLSNSLLIIMYHNLYNNRILFVSPVTIVLILFRSRVPNVLFLSCFSLIIVMCMDVNQ